MFGSSKSSSKKPTVGNSGKPPSSSGQSLNNEQQDEYIPEVDFKQIDKLLNSEIKDDDIQLTDADMEDPELLAQLSEIESGHNLKKPTPPPKPTSQQSTTTVTMKTQQQQVITKQPPPKQQKVKTEDDELNDLMNFDDDGNHNTGEDHIDHDLIRKLEERLIIYKKSALLANQQGNKTESLQYMKGSKIIAEAVSNLKEGLPIETSTLPPHINLPQQQQQQQQQQKQQSPPLQSQQQQNKSPVQQQQQQLQNKNLLSPKTEILSREIIEAEERNQIWDLIEEDFRRKHLKLTSEAVRLRDSDKVAAIHLLKESKGVHAIIDQIQVNRDLKCAPPAFHFEEVVQSTEISFPDIKETELVIKLSNASDIQKAISTDYTIYGELPYPSPEQTTKFQTGSITLAESSGFSYVTRIQIERKKTLQRCLEKKKMTLVFYSSRMFFMKSVVGKCEIKLSDLLNKCEINEKVPILKDGSKKETGSFLNVNIKMKTPLLAKELRVSKEKVLILDTPITTEQKQQTTTIHHLNISTTTTTSTNYNNAATTNNKPIDPITNQPIEPISPPPKIINTTTATVDTTTATTTTKTATTTTPVKKVEEEPEVDYDEMVDSLDNIVSNNVFEWILETINQQIAKEGPKADLLDRKQAVDIKVMVLETQIQSGIISIEMYIQQLEDAMAADKKLALELSNKGRKDLAVKVMQRIKLMKKELDECSQAEE